MCFRLRKAILSLIFIAASFPSGSYSEDLIPSAESLENFGPLVGVWQDKDKTIEIVFWFTRNGGRAGFITKNGCTEEIRISRDDLWHRDKSEANFINSDGEESLTSNVYQASTEPYSRGFSFDNTNCEEVKDQKPRYGKWYFLALIENNSTLLLALNRTGTRDFKIADILKRADLSKEHADQILLTQNIGRYTLSEVSSSAICLATGNYVRSVKMDATGGSGITGCPLFANAEKPSLSDSTIDEWRVNYDELGELFYRIYKKDYETARQNILYRKAYIWLIESYSTKCINEMPPPLTTVKHAWHTEVTTSTGWKYDKNQKTASFTMPTSYVVHYRAAYDHIESNPHRYLNVPSYSWIAESFINRGCSSNDLGRLLQNYAESFN